MGVRGWGFVGDDGVKMGGNGDGEMIREGAAGI